MVPLPSFDQLAELDLVLKTTAPPEYEDLNGHVNVVHHLSLHMQVCMAALAQAGVEARVADDGFTIFSAEHHLTYLNEIRIGDELEGRARLLGRGAKTVHGVSVLTDVTTGTIAGLCEWVQMAVDLNERRSTPFPEHVAAALDATIAQHATLPWSLPRAGTMGAR